MARERNDGKGRMGGRTRGTPNRITTSVKAWLSQLIDDNRQRIESDLQRLEPKDRLQMLEKLLQYVVPKQQAVSSTIELGRLTDSQLDELVNTLTKEISNENTD